MKKIHSLGLVLLLLTATAVHAAREHSPFGIAVRHATAAGGPVVRFAITVPTNCVLYSERLHFETEDGAALTPSQIPAPTIVIDKATGHEKKVFTSSFAAELKLPVVFDGNLVVKFQGCSNGACYFPEKRTFAPAAGGGFAEVLASEPAATQVASTAAAKNPAANFKVLDKGTGYMKSSEFVTFLDRSASGQVQTADDPMAKLQKYGLAVTLVLIVLGGLGLNLTPCVLPLIPINLAIIGAGTQAKSRRQGFMRGAIYGAGMALVYGVLGLVVVLTGSKFGALNSSVWFNVGIAVVFGVMALAMFDLVNIDLSRFGSSIGAGGNGGGNKSQAVIAFTLGAVAALLAGACVAPVVISVLLLSTNLYAKGLVIGLALPFLLGLGMALPWPFAGASLTFLPKPGKWMKYVKYGFGVLIVTFAGYYGHTAYSLAHHSAFVARAHSKIDGNIVEVDSSESLTQALEQARGQGRRVFVDFHASWCKNCLAMDETVFNQAGVQQKLQEFVVVRYQAERPNESPAREVLDKFGVMGLPTYVVLSPN
jgi:thiol:disulfide interchange protein